MVKLPSGRKSPFYVLGIPTFASASDIRAAYLKRIKALKPYQFDKSKQPIEWQAVNEVLEELNDAYARLRPMDKPSLVQAEEEEARSTPPIAENERHNKTLSYRENAEQAVQNYQRLTTELDDQQSKQMFIKLIAARGFRESQVIPSVRPGRAPAPAATNPEKDHDSADHRDRVNLPVNSGKSQP